LGCGKTIAPHFIQTGQKLLTWTELAGPIKANAEEEVLESRIIAHRIKERMHSEPLQNAFALLVRAFKPYKRLVIVTEGEVWINKGGCLDVTRLLTFLQFVDQAKCLGAVSGTRVGDRQQLEGARTAAWT